MKYWTRTAKAIPKDKPELLTDEQADYAARKFTYDGVQALGTGKFETPFFVYEIMGQEEA